jgi:PAS domain S-box-containing protein
VTSWSIRRRFPLVLVALLASVVAALTVTSYLTVRSRTAAAVEERLVRLGLELTRGIDTVQVQEAVSRLERAAGAPGVVAFLSGRGSPEAARGALDSALAGLGPLDDAVGLFAADGRLSLEASGADFGTLAAAPPSAPGPSGLSLLRSVSDTLVFYDISAPVRDGGTEIGRVVARARVADETSAAIGALLGPTAGLLIGNPDGSLWVDGHMVVVGPTAIPGTQPTDFARDGDEYLGLSVPYTGSPWIILLEVGSAEAMAPATDFLRGTVGMALVLVTLAGLAGWLLTRRATDPLNELIGAVAGIAGGDYSTRVRVAPPLEVARLGEAVNEMAAQIEARAGQLRVGRDRMRSLVDASAQIVWLARPDGVAQGRLPSWQAYTGLGDEEVSGPGWRDAVHPDDRARLDAALDPSGPGRTFDLECRIRSRDGAYRLFAVRGVPIGEENGGLREWIGACTDIQDRRRDELELRRAEKELRQAQKMEAIGRLAGGVAHDFNNILTGILASTEFARSHAMDPKIAVELDEVHAAAQRAADLTRQLLTISRSRNLNQVVLDLNEIVRESGRLLERIIGEQIAIRVALAEPLDSILADQVHVEQIILNMAVNARDAMPRGGTLTLETSNVRLGADYVRQHPSAQPGAYVMLAISDTGIGMDAATLERIFEPFFTTKGEGHGTGLGLATVHGIVQQAGGQIWAYSEPGQGTTFKVYLPAMRGSVPTAEKIEPQVEVVGGSEVVLVVEDDDAVRRVATRALSARGYEVLSAPNGLQALQILAQRPDVAIVVTDMVMPTMTGPELAARLREERPDLPVLFLSGYAAAAAIGRDLLRGDEPFLPKPFTPADLAGTVRGLLDARKGA